jgi:hypothetical protein
VTLLPTQDRFAGPPEPAPAPALPSQPAPPQRPPARPPLPPGRDEPVYARLVADWRAVGRTVPGEPDREWAQLTSGPARHGRR